MNCGEMASTAVIGLLGAMGPRDWFWYDADPARILSIDIDAEATRSMVVIAMHAIAARLPSTGPLWNVRLPTLDGVTCAMSEGRGLAIRVIEVHDPSRLVPLRRIELGLP